MQSATRMMSGVGWKVDTSWPLKHKSTETCKYGPADVIW